MISASYLALSFRGNTDSDAGVLVLEVFDGLLDEVSDGVFDRGPDGL